MDLISRQEAIDALRMCYETETITMNNGNEYINYDDAVYEIEELSSAQTEIIRCRDCKHRYLDGMIWNCPFGLSGGADFFCAYGAKMEVEHDSNIHAE